MHLASDRLGPVTASDEPVVRGVEVQEAFHRVANVEADPVVGDRDRRRVLREGEDDANVTRPGVLADVRQGFADQARALLDLALGQRSLALDAQLDLQARLPPEVVGVGPEPRQELVGRHGRRTQLEQELPRFTDRLGQQVLEPRELRLEAGRGTLRIRVAEVAVLPLERLADLGVQLYRGERLQVPVVKLRGPAGPFRGDRLLAAELRAPQGVQGAADRTGNLFGLLCRAAEGAAPFGPQSEQTPPAGRRRKPGQDRSWVARGHGRDVRSPRCGQRSA